MIVHLHSDNPKPIEQKVQELILKKLYIKIDDDLVFIDKAEFVKLILNDIMVLARANFNIDNALELALQNQVQYKEISHVKRNELEQILTDFKVEIQAYKSYLNDLTLEYTDEEIFADVLFLLNIEVSLLHKRLQELMIQSLSNNDLVHNAQKLNVTEWDLLVHYANQIKLLATNISVEYAIEEAIDEFKNYPNKNLIKPEIIRMEFELLMKNAKSEINAYQMAMSMYEQEAEFAMILALVKQLLHLED